jgi:hypothetical protein
MRVGSPGARVGQAWLNVDPMYGISLLEVSGSGMESGTFGFAVADVGRGGRPSSDGVRPGTSRVTTFCIDREFYEIISTCGEESTMLDGTFHRPCYAYRMQWCSRC